MTNLDHLGTATVADNSALPHPSNGVRKGERRGGRTAGTPNKSTAEMKELAQVHGPEAVALLAKLMKLGTTEAVQIAAAREILDRGYGKATQPIAGDDDAPPITQVSRVEFVIVDPDNQQKKAQ
jgi:hypothetical protein